MQDGIWLNSIDITNGPAAHRGTYVGTTRSEADSTIAWSRGSSAAGGGAAKLNVWNMYNRVTISAIVIDSTSAWSVIVVSPRPVNNSNNNRVSFVDGMAENSVQATARATATGIGTGTNGCSGVALDSTTVFDAQTYVLTASTVGIADLTLTTHTAYAPQLGFHFIQALEFTDSKIITFTGGGARRGL